MQFDDKDKVIIIDFGSQVTKLIARRIRELGVYSEIITPKELTKIKKYRYIKGSYFLEDHLQLPAKDFKVCRVIYLKKIYQF